MAGERILIIEDDPAMLRGLKDNFEFAGYKVATAATGEKGLESALKLKPDLVLLDLMLPSMNGYEICRAVREAELEMPIIMLTAKSQESDIVLGLNLGANDYVTKPFSIKELLARANAFLRARLKTQAQTRCFGDFELNSVSRKLLKKGRQIELTPRIFAPEFPVKNADRRSHASVAERGLGPRYFLTPRSVDRCINTLRTKIERRPANPELIRTVREIGYRFESNGRQA